MEDEGSDERERLLAAPFIFLIVAAFQFAYYCLDKVAKGGSHRETEARLREEIKQLSKEASLMSQPSTFAQAAKLKRLANAKEKELSKYHNSSHKDYAVYSKVVLVFKYLTYALLLMWFWRVPVASVHRQLVQPFGSLLSWKSGGVQSNSAPIGIISWLVVSARVCRFVRRAYSK
ncbi:uncharacterized protein LOC114171574 isoform X2 [Vigna unguiculata]|uniref:uncharacterized protein LOC114171574 isoform X2 n=1 Tax=Vigna unguiculata TaxID=3917 RepID=UPI001016B87D|nr:uncharacterized protein LOC114171574 isoform X2 [Vigna unguiculata]